MPEGDTVFRTGQTLHRVLAGRVVTRFESMYPALTRIDHDRGLAGRVVESVVSRGKHLLMTFSGNLVLQTHMRMHGSWHVYRPAERWQRPVGDMRVLVGTERAVAVAFNVPVANLLTAQELARFWPVQALGPDLTDPSFDHGDVLRRIREHEAEAIQEVLLNQRVMAGVGNVFKSEILFVAGVSPFTSARDLTHDCLCRVIDAARRLMAMNLTNGGAPGRPAIGRHTTGSLNPRARLWVYGRGGQPCRACGTPIEAIVSGADARRTYWCPKCQPNSP
jgi:endonuclease VIII